MTDRWSRWFELSHFTRIAIGLWIALILGVLGRVAVSPPTAQSVLPVYAMGGERWWKAEPLYAPPPPGMDLYRNPPGFAAFYAPISQCHPRLVGLLWRIGGIGLFAIGLRRWLANFELSERRRSAVWIVAAFLILPSFNNGQVNLYLAAAATHATAEAIRARWWSCAFWVSLEIWLKLYPIALAGLFVLLAPKQLLWRIPILIFLLFAWPFTVRDAEYIRREFDEFQVAGRIDDRSAVPLERTMKGWTYLARVWGGTIVDRDTQMIVSAASALLFAALIVFKSCRIGPSPDVYACTALLAILWMLLFGPSTESNTYSMLAPSGWLLVTPGRRIWKRALAGIAILMLIGHVIRGMFPQHPDHLLASLHPGAAFILLIVVIADLLRDPGRADLGEELQNH